MKIRKKNQISRRNQQNCDLGKAHPICHLLIYSIWEGSNSKCLNTQTF